MEFTDDVFYFLFPEQKQTGLYKYDIKKVIKIQRFVRKRQSMQLYRMKLAKKRKYGSLIFLKKWTITYEVYVFVMNAFYNKEEETFIFSTTNNPGIDVKPFTIPIKEVDKFEAGDNICNLRRVLDSISATVNICLLS